MHFDGWVWGMKLQFYQSSTHTGLTIVTPTSAPEELRRKFVEDDYSRVESVESFKARNIDYEGILGRIFKDPSYPDGTPYGRVKFMDELFMLIRGYKYYEDRPLFDNLLTQNELVSLWECSNYFSYHCDLKARYGNIPLLEDIISKAETAFSDPSKAADLRF